MKGVVKRGEEYEGGGVVCGGIMGMKGCRYIERGVKGE